MVWNSYYFIHEVAINFFLFFGSSQIYVQEMGEICFQIIIHGWLVCAAAVNEYNSFDCYDYVTCYSFFATWAVKFVIAKISDSGIRIYIYPVLGVLVFLPRNFLNYWHLLPKFCKFFQDRGKKSKKIFGLLGTKTKNIQDLGKRTKKNLGFLAKKFWIFCQKNLRFLRFAKILAVNLFLQGFNFTRFAKFCKIFQDRGKKSKKILEFLTTKVRITKILARETRKSCIKVIQDL